MPPARNYGGPKLPQTLLDQVGGPAPSKHQSNGPPGRRFAPATRKDKRKQDREQKRFGRQLPLKKKKWTPVQRQSSPRNEESEEEEEEEEEPLSPSRPSHPAKPAADAIPQPRSILKQSKPAILEKVEEFVHDTASSEPRPLSQREKENLAADDAEIAALEKKLGMKNKKLPQAFQEDGLDELLTDLGAADSSDGMGGKRRRIEDQEWLERKRSKADAEIDSGSNERDEELESEDGVLEEDEESSDVVSNEELFGGVGDAESGSDDDDEEDNDVSNDDEADRTAHESEPMSNADDPFDESDDEKATESPAKRVRENPYVAPGTDTQQSAAKYIPPSLRRATGSDTELENRLKRQVQGLLNRLSEANLISILGDIENLYRSNPRQYVTTTVIDLLLNLLCDPTTLSDTFIILHAGFVASIYKAIGPDFGAQILERIVLKFDQNYEQTKSSDITSGKEALNLISLLAQLYNLQVIGADLIFDYIRTLLTTLTELHTELLLRIIRSSGYQLRQDDPSSLKDIVLAVQNTITHTEQADLSVRTKFMIETINDLKNNKLKTSAVASAVTSEHLTRMKKILGSLNTRVIRGTEPLRIGLSDMRNTEKRGKWWLVGASWKGKNQDEFLPSASALDSRLAQQATASFNLDDSESIYEPTDDLALLAKEARMNTDIRRAIFVTLMSASDYKDAHLRLLKLNLTRTQELEIPRVLLHCAGTEQRYNPYYTLISRKLCSDHKPRKTFQFALWDLFKRMGERREDDDGADEEDEDAERSLSMASVVNHAKLFGSLIATGGLGIDVLKNLDLVYLRPKTRMFVEILLLTIFVECSSKRKSEKQSSALTVKTIFAGASDFPSLATGLQFFLKKVVAKTDLAKDESEKKVVRRNCKEVAAFLATGEVYLS